MLRLPRYQRILPNLYFLELEVNIFNNFKYKYEHRAGITRKKYTSLHDHKKKQKLKQIWNNYLSNK